ncbi:hypothetical protein IEQ34_000527 [Dendrobium chrysotoxum]|uniref:Late embryogenesis abundant protein LEA-2 subgroup domain-containing protein n=1 Tax=Dendrobium chrysotoxum TaxID=161865 RepID=A0AAV7HAI1_DENCH|nr:hypothetical protein IEQ34_000527 [Dendrobium chrysotoxum]
MRLFRYPVARQIAQAPTHPTHICVQLVHPMVRQLVSRPLLIHLTHQAIRRLVPTVPVIQIAPIPQSWQVVVTSFVALVEVTRVQVPPPSSFRKRGAQTEAPSPSSNRVFIFSRLYHPETTKQTPVLPVALVSQVPQLGMMFPLVEVGEGKVEVEFACLVRNFDTRIPPSSYLYTSSLIVESNSSDNEMIDVPHYSVPPLALGFTDYNSFPTFHRHYLLLNTTFSVSAAYQLPPAKPPEVAIYGGLVTMPKDCGNHKSYYRHKLYGRIFACFLSLVILVLFIILVVWLVLRPTKPKFLIQDTSVYQFSLSSNTNLLSSNLQVTISSRNPNDRIGIYYDRLDVFAEYKNQQITAATELPTGYQGHHDVNIWSPFLSGVAVSVSPYLVDSIGQDENAGLILIYIKISGRLRWKVGTWISGHYNIAVSCPAFLTVGNDKGNDGSPVFRFQQMSPCSVDV